MTYFQTLPIFKVKVTIKVMSYHKVGLMSVYVLLKFGGSSFNSKAARAKSLFFALIDPVT